VASSVVLLADNAEVKHGSASKPI